MYRVVMNTAACFKISIKVIYEKLIGQKI